MAAAGDAVAEIMLQQEVAELRAWRPRSRADSPAWRDAAFVNQTIVWLTPEELNEAGEAIRDIILKRMDRLVDPSLRPEGSRPVRMLAWGIPTD